MKKKPTAVIQAYTMRIPLELFKTLKDIAKKEKRSLNKTIEVALDLYAVKNN